MWKLNQNLNFPQEIFLLSEASCFDNAIKGMKIFLHSDWQREIQFSCNTVQKRSYKVTSKAFWLVNHQRKTQIANRMWSLDDANFGMVSMRCYCLISHLGFFHVSNLMIFSLAIWHKRGLQFFFRDYKRLRVCAILFRRILMRSSDTKPLKKKGLRPSIFNWTTNGLKLDSSKITALPERRGFHFCDILVL